MTEKFKQKIEEEILNLPKEIQEVINSFDWINLTEEIGKKYLLDKSEINDLQIETGLVMVGLIEIGEYSSDIENEIGISKEEAEKITEEANQKIFNPIYEKLSEKIKKSIEDKNIKWEQTIDFILSGGNYAVFLERKGNSSDTTEQKEKDTFENNSKIANIKSKFVI